MRVEVDVPNPKGLLRPGADAHVKLFLSKGTPGAVRLPATCIAWTDKDEPAVYVVRDGKARRTTVKLGHQDPEEVEITSGLKPTDLIVTTPDKLTEEVVPVKIKEGPDPK